MPKPLSPTAMTMLFGLAAAIPAAIPATAQPTDAQVQRMQKMQEERAQRQMRENPSQAKSQYIAQAFAIDPEGIVTAEKLAQQKARIDASMRARSLTQMLAHDLDADGRLSFAELEEAERFAPNTHLRAQIRMLRVGSDADGDGAISITELYDYADKNKRSNFMNRQSDVLLAMDGNGDGVTTIDEIVTHIDAVAAAPEPTRDVRPTIGTPRVVTPKALPKE